MTTNQSRQVSRRNLILMAGASTLAASLLPQLLKPEAAIAETSPKTPGATITPDQALKKLIEGNQRYVSQKRLYPDQNQARLTEVAKGQHPFAIVLGCADSRVPPEMLFDQGLGDIFDIRVAGNIVDDAVIASMEYAAAELSVPLLMVLGHERCGAVKAAVEAKPVPGHIGTLVAALQPAVDQVKAEKGDVLDKAVRANVKMSVEKLKTTAPILADYVKVGKLKIVGGRYDLDTGKVEIIA